MQIYEDEGLLTRAAELWPYLGGQAHALKGLPHVIDIRNLGLIAAIELAPRAGAPGMRGLDAHTKAFEKGAYIRVAGDIIALAPPLIIRKAEIDQLFEIVRAVLKATN